MNIDKLYMQYAINLAYKGQFTTTPNPKVGCIVVNDNKIVGKGWHNSPGKPHAEIYALLMAGNKAKGSTVYITLEPCNHFGRTPPCCDQLIKLGVKKVVIAIQDPNPQVSGNGIKKLEKFGIEVICGVMTSEAKKLNSGFIKRMNIGIPFIKIKIASSLDGCTAMYDGESKWISSIESRKDVQYLRAKSSAILSSSMTVLKDNPSLNVRWNLLNKKIKKKYSKKKVRQPIRIILDSKNRVTPNHKIVHQKGKTILVRLKKDNLIWPKNTEQLIIPSLNNQINLKFLFKILGKREINDVLVEAGSNLFSSLLTTKLVDEIIIYMSAKLLGNNTRKLFYLPNIFKISQSFKLSFKHVKRIGPDLRLILVPK